MSSVKQMIAIVQCYIHILKDKEVNINITNDKDILLLNIAYTKAIEYFEKN